MNEKKRNIIVTKTWSFYYSLKSKITKEKIKEWIFSIVKAVIFTFLILVVLYVFLYIVTSIVIYFPQTMKPQTVSQILSAIIEVNGIFLGFSGIIFAQVLASLIDQQNIVYAKLLDEPDMNSKRAKLSVEYLDLFEERKRNFVITVFITFILLVASIIESMKGLADVSKILDWDIELWTGHYISYPMLYMLGAIAVLLFSVFVFSLKPPYPSFKEEKSG
jgi:hypothetical protein